MSAFDLKEEQLSALETMRHSLAHILACAVKELYPEAKLAIGPPIEHGFYYDFDCDHPFVEQDLAKIQKRMKKIIARKIPFERQEMST